MSEATNSTADSKGLEQSPSGWIDRAADILPIGRRIDVPCTIELESTREQLYAHVSLENILINEGDEVLVHNAPTHVDFGEHITVQSSATVIKASALGRFWARVKGYFEITELYEVGFQPKE